MTGGRLKRVQPLLHNEHFHMTYGDGLANIDVERLVQHHVGANRKATVTSVRPPGRFGALDLDDEGSVKGFIGKPSGDGGYINGGFFILSPETLNEIDGDMTVWEGKPLETLAKSGQLAAYRHDGFWQPMDTLRDKNYLEDLWQSGQAPWKTWR